jgi:hypothetical protein
MFGSRCPHKSALAFAITGLHLHLHLHLHWYLEHTTTLPLNFANHWFVASPYWSSTSRKYWLWPILLKLVKSETSIAFGKALENLNGIWIWWEVVATDVPDHERLLAMSASLVARLELRLPSDPSIWMVQPMFNRWTLHFGCSKFSKYGCIGLQLSICLSIYLSI